MILSLMWSDFEIRFILLSNNELSFLFLSAAISTYYNSVKYYASKRNDENRNAAKLNGRKTSVSFNDSCYSINYINNIIFKVIQGYQILFTIVLLAIKHNSCLYLPKQHHTQIYYYIMKSWNHTVISDFGASSSFWFCILFQGYK